ncbi:hypothetical protein [Candidatus Magnetobacterium casense]|uniref:Holliday junction resolvase n=1 Tax=Candidatus Magnetobacterium casense TaxID=1455061 RepID=A0ABS6S1Y2_9BACT|nr:hypothetical protein [Candidatus Magnetobacterium casensis]MBV6342414.1 hypothetical protein [Candidatus Magnetobacterium casensis]
MRESVFQREVINSIKTLGGVAYKFPDAVRGEVDDGEGGKKQRFIPPKPFDIIACIGGESIAIECKMIKEVKAFPLKAFCSAKEAEKGVYYIEWNQIKRLLEHELTGDGKSYVFLNVRKTEVGNRKNVLIILSIWEIIGELERGAKSLPKTMIESLMEERGIHGAKGEFNLEKWRVQNERFEQVDWSREVYG